MTASTGSSSGIELVGWDDARGRPIYRRHNAGANSTSTMALSLPLSSSSSSSEDANHLNNIKKPKVRIEMNDDRRVSSIGRDAAWLESSTISSPSSLEDDGTMTTTTLSQSKLATLETSNPAGSTTKKKRSRKARTLSISPSEIVLVNGRNSNASGVQEEEGGGKVRKRSYGTVKPVMLPNHHYHSSSGLRFGNNSKSSSSSSSSDGTGIRLRLGWDEIKCRPIYEHVPSKRNNAIRPTTQDADTTSCCSASLPRNKKWMTSFQCDEEGNDSSAHTDDSLHNRRTQKKRVYVTHFRKKAGLSREVLDEMDVRSLTSTR